MGAGGSHLRGWRQPRGTSHRCPSDHRSSGLSTPTTSPTLFWSAARAEETPLPPPPPLGQSGAEGLRCAPLTERQRGLLSANLLLAPHQVAQASGVLALRGMSSVPREEASSALPACHGGVEFLLSSIRVLLTLLHIHVNVLKAAVRLKGS